MSKVTELVSSGHGILTQIDPALKAMLFLAHRATSYNSTTQSSIVCDRSEGGGREVVLRKSAAAQMEAPHCLALGSSIEVG
jgi:hypothetical protein